MLKKVLLSSLAVSSIYAGDISVESSTIDEWKSGFCKLVSVSNTTENVISWEVNLTVQGSIFQVWDATYVQNGEMVTYQGDENTALLNPDETESFGYCATKPISEDVSLLSITEKITADWGSGLCKDITLTNSSNTRVKWNLALPAEGDILNLWNANYTQDINRTLHLKGLDYNQIIEPSKSTTFGYCSTRVIEEVIMSDEESVQLDSDALSFDSIKNYNTLESEISKNLSLAVSGENGSTITWSSSNNSVITAQGTVMQPTIAQGEQSVILTATISKGDESLIKEFYLSVTVDRLLSDFNLGFGGSYAYKFLSSESNKHIWVSSVDLVLNENFIYNDYYQKIRNFTPQYFTHIQDRLKNSKFLVYWITKGWQVSWFERSKIQKAMDAGYVPVFNYWYFGDGLVTDMPNELEKQEYLQDALRVAEFLSVLKGKKIIIMEPEFNKNSVTESNATQIEFATIVGDAIDTIKAQNPQTLFSLAMMDKGNRSVNKTYTECGYANCALGDKKQWAKPSIIYNELLDRLDFISFQQNLAQFSRNPHNDTEPIAYTTDDLGTNLFASRAVNFTQFLNQKYNKPVFISSISVATASWSDGDSNGVVDPSEVDYQGWEEVAEKIYFDLSQVQSSLQANGLFGFAPMALFDNPMQDINGYQFFLQNEYHLGLIGSISEDEVDDGIDGSLIFKRNMFEYIFD